MDFGCLLSNESAYFKYIFTKPRKQLHKRSQKDSAPLQRKKGSVENFSTLSDRNGHVLPCLSDDREGIPGPALFSL